MEKFHSLSPREKTLILIMMALFAIVIIWQFILSPMSRAHDAAQKAQVKTQNDLAYVQRALPRLNSGTASGGQKVFSRSAVFKEASKAGAKISSVDAQRNGDIRIRIDDTQATALFKMLATIDKTYATRITAVNMTRRKGGLVSAQISYDMAGKN